MYALLFNGLFLIVACLCHAVIRRYVSASIVATISASALSSLWLYLQLVCSVRNSNVSAPSPFSGFLLRGFFLQCLHAAPVALLVGIFFVRYRRKYRKEGHCRSCGYNLTGNVSGVCPECGKSVD